VKRPDSPPAHTGLTDDQRACLYIGGIILALSVALPAFVASYRHGVTVVERSGDLEMAPFLPWTTDGLLIAALATVWVRRLTGRRVGLGPWAAYVLGMTAAVWTNVTAVSEPTPEAIVVAVWPPLVVAVVLELVAHMAAPEHPARPGVPVSRPATAASVPAVPAVSRAGRVEVSAVPAVAGVSRDAATATAQVDEGSARGVPVPSHPGTAATAAAVPVSHPVPGVSAQVTEVSHPAAVPVSQAGDDDEDGVSRGVPADRATETERVPGVPDLSPAERDAYRWAVQQQSDRRDVGFRQIQEEFPKLSKRDALKVAKAARGQAGTGLHAVG